MTITASDMRREMLDETALQLASSLDDIATLGARIIGQMADRGTVATDDLRLLAASSLKAFSASSAAVTLIEFDVATLDAEQAPHLAAVR